jgi:2-polyprenyl-3-methyl-5-hydroxy-6-metoxy-1,4-benzoquinol methylase
MTAGAFRDSLTFLPKRTDCPLCRGSAIEDAFTTKADRSGLCLSGFSVSLCRSCDYYFVNPQPDLTGLRAFYNSHAPLVSAQTFEEKLREYEEGGAAYRFACALVDVLPATARRGRLLDFGCNIGLLLFHNKERFASVTGVEINEEALKFARERFGLTQLYNTLDAIPSGERFDVITLIDVIEHVPDPVGLLASLQARLNPGGAILLRLPVIDGLAFRREAPENWKWVYAPYHLSMFSTKALASLGRAAGLGVQIKNDPEMFLRPEFIGQRLDTMVPAPIAKIRGAWPIMRRFLTTVVSPAFRPMLGRRFTAECVFAVCENG